jgi:hypothetical protein
MCPLMKWSVFRAEPTKGIRLRIEKEESSQDGKATIFASEGAIMLVTLKVLLFPFSSGEYVKTA